MNKTRGLCLVPPNLIQRMAGLIAEHFHPEKLSI